MTNSEQDRRAVLNADMLMRRTFLDPIFRGTYPPLFLRQNRLVRARIKDGDMHIIATPLDYLGINTYTRDRVATLITGRNSYMNSVNTYPLRGPQFAVWLLTENFPINFAFTARIEGPITTAQLQHALSKLQCKHPLLSMRLKRETNGTLSLISEHALECPLRILNRTSSDSWEHEVARELAHPFDLFTEPPLRVTWMCGDGIGEMILTCSHVLMDGLSAAYLIRDLLVFLSNPEANVDPILPTPAMSEMIPAFPGKSWIVWRAKLQAALFRLLLGSMSRKDASSKKPKEAVRRPYHLLFWEVPPPHTAALLTRSRQERTTVHAALSAAFLRAFGEFRRNGWKRKIQSPINLRDRLTGPVGESCGLYVNLIEFVVTCGPERDFWEVAREIKQQLIRHTDERHIYSSLIEANVLMDTLASVMTPQAVAHSMRVTYDLSITNLGRLDFPTQYGSLRLDALFGPSLGGNPEDIVLGVITIGEKMHLTLAWTDLKLSVAGAKQIKDTAMEWLAKATNW